MSSSSSLSPPDRSDDGSAVPSTESSNYTLLYIIIAVLVGVIMYVAIRYGRSVLAGWRQLQAGHGGTPGVFRLGLSVADIAAFPTFTYRARAASASPYGGGSDERRSGGKGRAAAECVVCLQELEDGDVVRVLPACRHFFHDRCIDAWLCAHATCPVCRAHPEPEIACLGEPVAVSPPLPQLRQCGASPERPTASRILADILARSPMMSKSPSPRVQFGSRSPSPTPPGYGCRVDDRWTKSPPPGVSEIVIARSKSPSPIRFSRQLSARSIGVLEIMEMTTSASPSPVPIREDGGGSL